MSGFFGMIREDGSSVDERLLERIAEELRVRGPDGTQIWTEEGKGCCFTLLRTEPGRQTERQPVFLDGKNWLLGDVRLDARKELLAVLEADGEGATGEEHSSETLLLRAWEKWGEASLPRMMGDFRSLSGTRGKMHCGARGISLGLGLSIARMSAVHFVSATRCKLSYRCRKFPANSTNYFWAIFCCKAIAAIPSGRFTRKFGDYLRDMC